MTGVQTCALPISLPTEEVIKLRGQSDALALRLRHHDDSVHAQRMPARKEAKDAYDALEQVRVEVIGAEFMHGVNANLRAKLTEECVADGLDRMTRKDQLTIDRALALLAREKLSGEPSPEPARWAVPARFPKRFATSASSWWAPASALR